MSLPSQMGQEPIKQAELLRLGAAGVQPADSTPRPRTSLAVPTPLACLGGGRSERPGEQTLQRAAQALDEFQIEGLTTAIPFHRPS